MINLELPWPPTINHYWQPTAKHGRVYMYMSSRAKAWRTDALWLIRQQLGTFEPMPGKLKVTMQLTPPRNAGDIDNYNKPIFDALEHAGVIKNDKQIKELHSTIRPSCAPGMVRMVIEIIST